MWALVAMAALAYALCDALHELGHLAATQLPLGVEAVSISTIGIGTTASSTGVALAGPFVNLALALALLLAQIPKLSPAWRYFAWLFGTINLFDATAYLLYSAILGSGDWAVVFGAFAAPSIWRPIAGLAGLLCYAGSVRLSLLALRGLIVSGVVAESRVDRSCTTSYWAGGLLLTLGAAFNPVSLWFVLTSGAATGFGAMIGLLLLPRWSRQPDLATTMDSLHIGRPWIIAGAVATIVFVGVLGPGVRLG